MDNNQLRLAVLIYQTTEGYPQNPTLLVAIEYVTTWAFLPPWELERVIDAYSKQYAIKREGLFAVTYPLLPNPLVDNTNKQDQK